MRNSRVETDKRQLREQVEFKGILETLVKGEDLDQDRAEMVMESIMSGSATQAQIGSFITALRMKGETVDEITGCARVMREHAASFALNDNDFVDTCGTGGDGTGTFNISTTAAFVVAAAGFCVAKHGNRSVSSRSGSADVLEELGVKIDLLPEDVERCLDEVGIGFLYAPVFHKAMKHAIGPRRELGLRTIFNVLGPLTNPAKASMQVLGVYSPQLTEPVAGVLKNLGIKAAYVVHGEGGLDELSILGETKVSEVRAGKIKNYTVAPEDFGLRRCSLQGIKGGTVKENACITKAILSGKTGPQRDITVLNAGAAITAAEGSGDIMSGIKKAEAAIDSGAAMSKLKVLSDFSNNLANKAGEKYAG